MPCAEIARNIVFPCVGEDAPRLVKPRIADKSGAVMKRRIGEENIADKLVGYLRVEFNPGIRDLFGKHRPFKNDKGTRLAVAHTLNGLADFNNGIIERLTVIGYVIAENTSQGFQK